jgi:hypothetical protein
MLGTHSARTPHLRELLLAKENKSSGICIYLRQTVLQGVTLDLFCPLPLSRVHKGVTSESKGNFASTSLLLREVCGCKCCSYIYYTF